MEFYYYTEPDSLIHEVRPFMGLKYLEVSLLSEKDQKSNGTNPRIQSRFGKNVPHSKFQKAEEGKDWREKKVVFLLHFISGQLLHILHLSSLASLQFVLDPGMHEARDWTQSLNNGTLGLISCFTFYSFSHQLLFQWVLLLCFCPTPFPFLLRSSLHFVLENDSPHTLVLKSIIFFLILTTLMGSWVITEHKLGKSSPPGLLKLKIGKRDSTLIHEALTAIGMVLIL